MKKKTSPQDYAKKEKQDLKTESKLKKPPKWFYLILLLIPVLFFVLLELGLRVFDYGHDFTVFKIVTDYHPDKLFLNPEIPYKYFMERDLFHQLYRMVLIKRRNQMHSEYLYLAEAQLPAGLMCQMHLFHDN